MWGPDDAYREGNEIGPDDPPAGAKPRVPEIPAAAPAHGQDGSPHARGARLRALAGAGHSARPGQLWEPLL